VRVSTAFVSAVKGSSLLFVGCGVSLIASLVVMVTFEEELNELGGERRKERESLVSARSCWLPQVQ
jgi:hypothetical protein